MGKEKEINLRLKEVEKACRKFRRSMRASHDPERAKQEKRYLKSPYRFFGVSVPLLRKLAKDFRLKNPNASREFVYTLAETLWGGASTTRRRAWP